MKINADTNVLLRSVLRDDTRQGPIAKEIMKSELVAVTTAALCEFAWVLTQGYKLSRQEVALAIRTLTRSANVVLDNQATEAGLAMLDAGGDFADGVIAHQGAAQGADVFATFDRQAAKLLGDRGLAVQLLD